MTNRQWKIVGWPLPRQKRAEDRRGCTEADCPVGNVTFFDAVSFANRLSRREGFAPCYAVSGCKGEVGDGLECASVRTTAPSVYACEGYRLPTEAEWEYAARAGTTTAFYTGPIEPRDAFGCYAEPALESIAWYCNNSSDLTHPVARKRPNAWGLHDMLGNAFEYCNDLMDRRGYGRGPLLDPHGTLTPGPDLTPTFRGNPGLERLRIVRGGGASSAPLTCKANTRHFGAPEGADSGAGFRLARTLPR